MLPLQDLLPLPLGFGLANCHLPHACVAIIAFCEESSHRDGGFSRRGRGSRYGDER
jgi:hypothetical protein